jgi:hypothetical protein
MVVKVDGKPALSRPDRTWKIWTGPITLVALFVLLNLHAVASLEVSLSVGQAALLETAGLLVVMLPFMRLVRDVNVGRYGIEACFYRGTCRYLHWDEIATVTLHSHAFVPSRILVEDVYGRRLYLKGEFSSLAPVLQALGQRGLRP